MNRILLAVSGGIDSMYMLERASELFPGASFSVAHCNFSLRGEESDGDETFVKSRCEALGVKLFAKRFDTKKYAAEKGVSIEMAARDLRYDWFLHLCEKEGFDALAVAHNANDNAETLFLNLLRGTGLKGLRGMKGSSPRQGLNIIRPLLETTREEIREWMEANGHSWREDSTNSKTDEARRNMVRGEVFPIFSKINPSFLKTLGADIERFAQASDILDEWFEKKAAEMLLPDGSINAEALRGEPHKAYLLWRLLEPYGINESILDSLLGLIEGKGQFAGKEFLTPTHRILTASLNRIIVCALGAEGSGRPNVKIIPRSEIKSVKAPKGVLYADADKLSIPITIRKWQSGDWIQPLGMRGKKKVSDLFVDLKYSIAEKEQALVIEIDGSHVGALLFERIDNSLKITASTERVLVISK